MDSSNKKNGDLGYSLVEVLAALVILSIVTLAMTAFFTSSLSFTKGNQSKTVMVNLARNALVYLEKQPFDPIKKYYITDNNNEIACDPDPLGCNTMISGLVDDPHILYQVLNPTINKVQYKLTIEYQRDIHNKMLKEQKSMAELLIPIQVKVERADGRGGNRNITGVEGYISSEKIR
ncbi:type IV pilus modification PilV family protein [Paenibacillus sp. SN-8-1]|uniref:type IV pilus modification PilV family protein n=1 Tax=Paenibacillus sp. SN-8-1 TaxID=3435409 RepID=UPI003D9A7EB1